MSGQLNLALPSGGSVTVAAPDSASDTTVTLPAGNNTLGIQGPAFSAYQSSAQSINNATFTKVQFQTEEFDTANCFDNATNYRFTPNVAGYYQINGSVGISGFICISIYKNGTEYKRSVQAAANGTLTQGTVASVVYLNGSTDYVELWCYQGNGATQNSYNSAYQTYLNGTLVRAA